MVKDITGDTPEQLEVNIRRLQECCVGASRSGAQGAKAKLEYIIKPALHGTKVIIAHSCHRIEDIISGKIPCTRIGLNNKCNQTM